MINVYMLNHETGNRIFIRAFETEEEARDFIAEHSTQQFLLYIGV